MKVQLTHPTTKQTIEVDVAEVDHSRLAQMLAPRQSWGAVRQQVDNLPCNRDTKALLSQLGRLTLRVGGTVLQVGQKLLEVTFALLRRYPNTTFYTLMGFALGSLISAIPLLGWLLGWLVLPLFTAVGLAMGLWSDFLAQRQQRELERMVEALRLAQQPNHPEQGGEQS